MLLLCSRVDGLMWLNLDEDAWVDIGIDNRFYMRKMQLIMPQFARYGEQSVGLKILQL